jgi:hypothetical protein
MAVEIEDPKRAIPLDKLTRPIGWLLGEGHIAYMGSLSFLVPNPDPLVIVRDQDGEALWDISDPTKNGRNVALGPDGEVAVAWRVSVPSGADPEANQFIDLYDDQGTLLWSILIIDAASDPEDASAGFINQMVCDSDGNIFYVAQNFLTARFGKLSHATGAHLFLYIESLDEEVAANDNRGCAGICCDPDGNVILTYGGRDDNLVVRKRSGAAGTSLWTITGTNTHQSPRSDGDGNIFVAEALAGKIKKLNGATGATLLQSTTLTLISGEIISIDDTNNLVWFNYGAGGGAGLNLDTLHAVPNAVITDPTVRIVGAVDGTIYVIRPSPASVAGYSSSGEGTSGDYTEDWRVTHDIAFEGIGPFAQRFIGDV